MCGYCDPYDCPDDGDYGYDHYDEMPDNDDDQVPGEDPWLLVDAEDDLPDEAWAKLDRLRLADEVNPPQPTKSVRCPPSEARTLSCPQPASRSKEPSPPCLC